MTDFELLVSSADLSPTKKPRARMPGRMEEQDEAGRGAEPDGGRALSRDGMGKIDPVANPDEVCSAAGRVAARARVGTAERVSARYAIYYTPDPSGPLWTFGTEVLGYDAATGAEVPPCPCLPIDARDWSLLTEEPRRYGFHATLKAPFSLVGSAAEDDLVEAARRFARGCVGFDVPALEVATLGDFVALVPDGPAPALDLLAADCVRRFERFRAPLPAADRARRLAAPLTERQIRHLDAWGYPHVFEDFRFHMTLTGRLTGETRERIRAFLARRHAALPPGLRVDAITIVRQESREARFEIAERCAFGS